MCNGIETEESERERGPDGDVEVYVVSVVATAFYLPRFIFYFIFLGFSFAYLPIARGFLISWHGYDGNHCDILIVYLRSLRMRSLPKPGDSVALLKYSSARPGWR